MLLFIFEKPKFFNKQLVYKKHQKITLKDSAVNNHIL